MAEARARALDTDSCAHVLCVRLEHPDAVWVFEADPHDAHSDLQLVRVERVVDGVVEHYEGAAGEEQRVRRETPEGDVYHWAVEPGVEALVRVERATGEVSVIALFPRYPVMLSCDI